MNANFNNNLNLLDSINDITGGTLFTSGGPGGQFGESYKLIPSSQSPQIINIPPVSGGIVSFDFCYRDLSTQFGSANYNWFIHLMDSTGSTSLNARATVLFDREVSANSSLMYPRIRNGDTFDYLQVGEEKSVWRHMGISVNLDTDTYEVDVQGRTEAFNVTSKLNTGNITRIMIAAAHAQAFSIQIADPKVYLGSRDILRPILDQGFQTQSTDISGLLVNSNEEVTLYPQYWQTTDNPIIGNWTKTTDGLAPGTGTSMLMADVGSSGRWEAKFKTGSGNNYMGLIFNAYEGTNTNLGTEDACFVFRYANASASDVALFQGSTTLGSAATATGVTIGTGEYHTIAVERLSMSPQIYCYIDNVIQMGGPVTINTTAQQRGLDGETWAGVYHAASLGAGNDRCVSFKFSETPQPWREVIDTGQLTAVLKPTCVRELYLADSGSTENIYSGKGMQQQHRAAAEGSMDRSARLIATIDTPLVQCRTMRGFAVNSATDEGETESITTIVGNRIHLYERLISAASNSYTTDNDYRMRGLITNGVAVVGSVGSASTFNPLTNHNWTTRVSAGSLPMGHQVIYEYNNGRAARINAMMINVGSGSLTAYSLSKHKGHDPLSITLGVSDVAVGVKCEYAISYLYDSLDAAAISTSRLEAIRDDRKTLTGWTVTTGSLKTDDTGDLNADGFNEMYGGWWVFNASNGNLIISSATARIEPVFRIYGLGSQVAISVGGVKLESDEYIIQDLGDGSTVVALLVDVAASTKIDFLVEPSLEDWNALLKYKKISSKINTLEAYNKLRQDLLSNS